MPTGALREQKRCRFSSKFGALCVPFYFKRVACIVPLPVTSTEQDKNRKYALFARGIIAKLPPEDATTKVRRGLLSVFDSYRVRFKRRLYRDGCPRACTRQKFAA